MAIRFTPSVNNASLPAFFATPRWPAQLVTPHLPPMYPMAPSSGSVTVVQVPAPFPVPVPFAVPIPMQTASVRTPGPAPPTHLEGFVMNEDGSLGERVVVPSPWVRGGGLGNTPRSNALQFFEAPEERSGGASHSEGRHHRGHSDTRHTPGASPGSFPNHGHRASEPQRPPLANPPQPSPIHIVQTPIISDPPGLPGHTPFVHVSRPLPDPPADLLPRTGPFAANDPVRSRPILDQPTPIRDPHYIPSSALRPQDGGTPDDDQDNNAQNSPTPPPVPNTTPNHAPRRALSPVVVHPTDDDDDDSRPHRPQQQPRQQPPRQSSQQLPSHSPQRQPPPPPQQTHQQPHPRAHRQPEPQRPPRSPHRQQQPPPQPSQRQQARPPPSPQQQRQPPSPRQQTNNGQPDVDLGGAKMAIDPVQMDLRISDLARMGIPQEHIVHMVNQIMTQQRAQQGGRVQEELDEEELAELENFRRRRAQQRQGGSRDH
ncbi:hypothetical protein EIP91_011983 [Steccherinum ochraceum]|uniref:Uncharacterized protein n=1 Tax=Steccherinum ochraceum TaxID=92696 RepID=A0A4R0RHD7_9APHY|nr:hypothetical protein EIP91_011983 [Steccherinum ochraceum]